MTEKIKEKTNKALDILIDKEVDLSNILAKDGLLKELTKNLVERALKTEMEEHLGYKKYSRSEIENSRNGRSKKKLITDNGVLEVKVPRDRNADFEPALIPKRVIRIDRLN